MKWKKLVQVYIHAVMLLVIRIYSCQLSLFSPAGMLWCIWHKGDVNLLSEAAEKEYQLINACPPKDAGKFALKLLSMFYSPEVLSRSNCTKAEGRDLLDPHLSMGIKRK